MTPSIRLGGFKILKGMARFAMVIPDGSGQSPPILLNAVKSKKINLPYFTCIHSGGYWGLNMLVEAAQGLKMSLIIEEVIGSSCTHTSECAVLSIFPHKKDTQIIGKLMEAFSTNGVKYEGIAYSPSAISIVLEEELINRASEALFGPFSFSAYRTPEDWKLAQKGKEHIYKEVIASYQESRPKVYGLEYYDDHELYLIDAQDKDATTIRTLNNPAPSRRVFSFSASYPSTDCSEDVLAISLSRQENTQEADPIINEGNLYDSITDVVVFSMNGPHFGDRYGIAFDLMNSLEKHGVDILCLSCTIASITGVINSSQLDTALEAIKECFEVPSVIKK